MEVTDRNKLVREASEHTRATRLTWEVKDTTYTQSTNNIATVQHVTAAAPTSVRHESLSIGLGRHKTWESQEVGLAVVTTDPRTLM